MSAPSDPKDLPSDKALEAALRRVVRRIHRSGSVENLTVKRVRKSAEEELGLEGDFFKNDAIWKEQSKSMIKEEVDAQVEDVEASFQRSQKDSPKAAFQPRKKLQNPRNSKRALTEKAGPKKRRKKESTDEVDSEGEEAFVKGNNAVKGKSKANKKEETPQAETQSMRENETSNDEDLSGHRNCNDEANGFKDQASDSEVSDIADTKPEPKTKGDPIPDKEDTSPLQVEQKVTAQTPKSDSDMSEVIDEGPKPKRKRKSKSAEPTKTKPKGSKASRTSDGLPDPDGEEIKRLQGWLVKCGIRKMWFRELAAFDTSKAKIKHLKGMLVDAGMTGRYSEAKAEQIKEERELKADLEAVQEGAKKWGQENEDNASTGRPKRSLARGLEGLDFLNDDDGEETD